MKYRGLRYCTVLWILWAVEPALACKIAGKPSPIEMVAGAELIVRATAVEYAVPANGTSRTTGLPGIRFRVESVLKGTYQLPELVLPGFLTNQDDWNDLPSPYSMVRKHGRSGNCFANDYRQGSQFLLVLKLGSNKQYTVNWYPLGPVNEQLRSPDDPWLRWVREQTAQ